MSNTTNTHRIFFVDTATSYRRYFTRNNIIVVIVFFFIRLNVRRRVVSKQWQHLHNLKPRLQSVLGVPA